MRAVAALNWDAYGWATPLARAQVKGDLPEALQAPRLVDVARTANRADMPAAFLTAFLAELPAAERAPWVPLGTPGARAVVTGQQPGCAGGTALVLYKAATAVALAQRLTQSSGRPVVPVFWNATDDEDFEEIARVGWLDAASRLAFLELPREARTAAGWVGDLPAAGDEAAVQAALATIGSERRGDFTLGLAADHGAWVGAFLRHVFPELAVLDARSVALRRHAAPLFRRYLEARDAVPAAVEAQIAGAQALGFERTLAAASVRAGLYWTPDRRRQKIGDDWTPLLTAVERAPETLSPNVLLRALVQDTLLPTVAQVVGPAEIAYLVELRPLRRLLDVAEPALVARLTATLVPEPAWEAWQGLGESAESLVRGPDAGLAAAASERERPAREALAAAFAAWPDRLAALGVPEAPRVRAARKMQGVQEELDRALVDAARAGLLASRPALAGLETRIRPRGQAQERVVAGLWLCTTLGPAVRTALLELAGVHLDALAGDHAAHYVVAH